MKTRDYIDLVRKLTPTGTDYAVHKLLGVSEATINHYTHGRRVMDNRTALRVAILLNRNVAELIAAAEMERTTDPKIRKEWAALFQQARTGAALLALAGIAALTLPHGGDAAATTRNTEPVEPSGSDTRGQINTLTIMRQLRRSLWRRLRHGLWPLPCYSTPCAEAP